MKNQNEKLSIYSYTDIKAYLRDYREDRKACELGFTNEYICYSLGQKNSRGYFNNVISGRVRIGSAMIERFVTFLKLSSQEAAYFRALVNYSQATDSVEQNRYFKELLSLNQAPSRQMDKKAFLYYTEWYHAVVRAALDICNFDESDYNVLLKRIVVPVTEKEIRHSIQLLKEPELVALNKEGFLKPTEKAIQCGRDIQSELVRSYQASNLKLSSEAILDTNIDPQKVTALTVSVSDETFIKIKERIDQLRTEIRALVQQDDEVAEKLYQLNIHLFPQLR